MMWKLKFYRFLQWFIQGDVNFVLVLNWLVVVVQWFTSGGCEIYSLVPGKKFVEFLVCNWTKHEFDIPPYTNYWKNL